MIEFKRIELEDKPWVDACLKEADYKGCEYSFSNNYIWRSSESPKIAKVNDNFCATSIVGDTLYYAYPAGKYKIKETILALKEDAKERGIPFQIKGITEKQLSQMKEWFPEEYDYKLRRDDSDYIYTTEKLTKLAGKKLHGKRNHIARFKDCEDWGYYEITKDNIKECFEMSIEWCQLHGCGKDSDLSKEFAAVEQAFMHFDELGLKGGFVRREGKIVAYTIGEPLSSDTFVVHIEKAFPEIQGAYPIINQQFVEHTCQDYMYVNREEDTGEEGLRKAKLSYKPDLLLDKYEAVLRD